nr:DUF3104 domain-containing protein [Synechococcus sp. MIT S9504]
MHACAAVCDPQNHNLAQITAIGSGVRWVNSDFVSHMLPSCGQND